MDDPTPPPLETYTPPVSPDGLAMEAQPPTWPHVIGIISIVWGAFLLTCGGAGLAWMALMPTILAGTPAADALPPDLMANPAIWASAIAGLLLDVLLVIAGVATVRRRRVGRTLHIVYAVCAILVVFWSVYMQLQIQDAMRQSMEQQSGQGQPPGAAIGRVLGPAFALIFGLAWPLFCIVWFTLTKRARDMTGTP